MKKLTAMVSLYNAGDWIENRILNLRASTIATDLDIWCYNANSPDDRDEMIPRKMGVHYIQGSSRISVYEAWNEIIKASSSVYLANANADDIVSPNCYERLITALDGGAGFAYPNWYVTDKPNQQWTPNVQWDPSGCPGQYNGDLDCGGVGHFPMWSRALHNRFGLFDGSFGALGDADWWARCFYLSSKSVRFLWITEFLACYLWRNGDNLWHRSISPEEWARYHAKAAQYQEH